MSLEINTTESATNVTYVPSVDELNATIAELKLENSRLAEQTQRDARSLRTLRDVIATKKEDVKNYLIENFDTMEIDDIKAIAEILEIELNDTTELVVTVELTVKVSHPIFFEKGSRNRFDIDVNSIELAADADDCEIVEYDVQDIKVRENN